MTDFNYNNSSDKGNLTIRKPKIPEKHVQMINGCVTPIHVTKSRVKEIQSELTKHFESTCPELASSNANNFRSKEQLKPKCYPKSEVISKSESIKSECLAYINQVHNCLSYLMSLKEELDAEYANDGAVMKSITNVFRDIQSLKSTYQIIQETIDRLKSDRSRAYYVHEVFLDPAVANLLKMYKPFLNNYAAIIRWTTDFNRDHQPGFHAACDRASSGSEGMDTAGLDHSLYTVFNSLFSLELMLDRYRKCFEVGSTMFKKSSEAKDLISSILKVMNENQDQESFMLTQKELSFLTGRSKEAKVNIRFIRKDIAIKLSRRDNKPLSRQLVLFSSCLYVTLLPSNILGTSSVRYELSLDSMKVSEARSVAAGDEESSLPSGLQWGLTINAKEAVQDFYFDSEHLMRTWKESLLSVLSKEAGDQVMELSGTNTASLLKSLGLEAPRWQKDKSAGYCNGYKCSQKFSTSIRRHHCRADGLLYCDACCGFKVHLNFERSSESRVCELCYQILALHRDDPVQVAAVKQQLQAVMERKTHEGSKAGWLRIKEFNREKLVFLPEVKYFCELDRKEPILEWFEKKEDKFHYERIDLTDVIMVDGDDVKYFILEDRAKTPLYHLAASNEEECRSWIECLKERITLAANI